MKQCVLGKVLDRADVFEIVHPIFTEIILSHFYRVCPILTDFVPNCTELFGVLIQTLLPCVLEEAKFFGKFNHVLVTLLKLVQTSNEYFRGELD